jgi:23S rRNA (pseudouridine1915-N3)-methyltransferase
MIKIRLICMGKLKEPFWRAACSEYEKRLRPFCSLSFLELPESRLPAAPSQKQILRALEEEGRRILRAASGAVLAALCIEGERISSEQLAERIGGLAARGAGPIAFAVGSSYGLSGEVKRKADFRLSLSPMTFPHQLARVMLCEQLYRSFEILGHGKYHK